MRIGSHKALFRYVLNWINSNHTTVHVRHRNHANWHCSVGDKVGRKQEKSITKFDYREDTQATS